MVEHIALMAQSQCRRSFGDKFWLGVVVENKESLNNDVAMVLIKVEQSHCLRFFNQVLSKNRGMSLRWPPIASKAIGDDICERLFFY